MGQYFKLVNLDKKEFTPPHKLAAGLKAVEVFHNGGYVFRSLGFLLSTSNGRGGGDFDTEGIKYATETILRKAGKTGKK